AVFGIRTAVLDLELDRLARAGALHPEAEAVVAAPVLRSGQVVREAAPAADGVRDAQRVVAGCGARPVGGPDLGERRRRGRVAGEGEDAGVPARERHGAL